MISLGVTPVTAWMIFLSNALPQTLPIDDLDERLLKCMNMTSAVRKLCRMEITEETQLKIQMASLNLLFDRNGREQTKEHREQAKYQREQARDHGKLICEQAKDD